MSRSCVTLEPRVQTLICARVNQLAMLEMIIPPLNRESLLDGYILTLRLMSDHPLSYGNIGKCSEPFIAHNMNGGRLQKPGG